MSAWCLLKGNAIAGSEIEPLRAMHWWGHNSFGFEISFVSHRIMYGNTVDIDAPVATGSSVSCLVEDDDHYDLGAIPLSWNTDVRMSLQIEFTVIQTQGRHLGLAILDKTCNVFGLALRVHDALPQSGEAGTRIASLEASSQNRWRRMTR